MRKSSIAVIAGVLWVMLAGAVLGFDAFIEMRDGYFYDPATGEPWVPHGIAYQTWNRPLGVWQTYEQIDYDLDEIVKMGGNSVRIDMVWQHIEGDGATSVAEGDNNFDWEKYDYFVQACEERGLRIFALIGYQWPPNWFPDEWYTMHPPEWDAEGIYHDERWQSDIINYEHPEARAQYAEWLGAVSAHFKDSKAIVGWIVGNESGYLGLWSGLLDGYDPESEAAFRLWCENKYGTIANVNAAWGTSLSDFSEITFVEQYRAYGVEGAIWADMVQWREDSIASFTAVGAVGCKAGDTNHLISYSTVGMQWGEEDWRYHAEDRGKITEVCIASNAPIDFFSVNNYPWSVLGHESQNGHWGISYTKKTAKVPVLYSETGFTSSETMWPGMNEYRQGPLVRNALWESLEAGAIGTHIFSWMDRPYITDREKGFGIVYADRRVKPALWTSKEAYNLMEQVDIHDLLMNSEDPTPDIAFLWTAANDSQYNRYECEMQQIAGALERLGYEPYFIDLQDLANGEYLNYEAVILPRNMRVEDTVPGYTNSILNFLLTHVIADGVDVMATADLPGMQNFNGQQRAAFEHELDELFGIDASDIGGYEAPMRRREYVSWYWKLISVDFNANSPINGYHCWPQVWKYSDEVEVTDGMLWATMDSGRNKGYEDSDTAVEKWDGTWGDVHVRSGWGWAYDGNNMVQMWGDSGMWDDFEVVPFGRYTHSAYLRSNASDPLAGGQEALVAIEWRDQDGNVISTSESAHLTSATPGDSWVEYKVDAIAPADAWTARRIVRVQGSGSGSVYVDHKAGSPAVVVKDHGTAKAGIFLFSAGDQKPDGDLNGDPDVYPWQWRYDYFGAMVKDYFGIEPQVEVTGANAYLCLAEHRTCEDGSTLWQLKNYMYDTNYPAGPADPIGGGDPQIFTLTSDLFVGKTVKAFYQSKIIEENSDGTISVTLDPDGMEMLHVYDSGAAGDDEYTAGSTENRMRRCNNARTGVAASGPQSFPLTGVWTTYVGYGCGTPVVAGDRIYVAQNRYMKCLDVQSGDVLWTFDTEDDIGGTFNPYGVAVADGLVYGTTKNLSGTNYPNGAVFAVDAGNGTLVWRKEAPQGATGYNNYIASPVVVEDGVAYFYLSGVGIIAVNASTGETIWENTRSGNHYNGGAVVSGKLYQANTQWLHCINTDDGTTNWTVYISGYCDSTPAVSDGKVYIVRGSAGQVYVHDADTGARLWATTNYYSSKSSVTIADGKMYFAGYPYGQSASNHIYCFDASGYGEPLWSFPVGASGYRTPIYADGVLYYAADKFYAVDAATGAELWSYDTTDTYYDPAVRHGWAFYSAGYRIYAYSDGSEWPEPVSTGNEIVTIQDTPAVVHPLGDKSYGCKIGYECLDRTDLTLKLAFCENGDNGDGAADEIYEQLDIPVTGDGTHEFWLWIPDADQNDSDYISTTDGGSYHFRAWLEDADTNIVAEAIPVPTVLEWGVRPIDPLPTNIVKGEQYEIPIEWENLYEYLPWEVTPLTRNEAFPNRIALFRSTKTEQQYPGQLDRVNEVADWLESLGYENGNPLDLSFDNVSVTAPGPVTEWGHTAEFKSGYSRSLRTGERVSFKITAEENKTLSSIAVYLYNYYMLPIDLSVYPDQGGIPGSTPVSSTTFIPPNTSTTWREFDLPDFTWTAGQTYHFVFSMNVATSSYAYMYYTGPATDGRGVLYDTGGGWISQDAEPAFDIEFADGSSKVQPYRSTYIYSVYNGYHRGERFTPETDLTVSGLKVFACKNGTLNGDLGVSIRKWGDQSLIAEGAIPVSSVSNYPYAGWVYLDLAEEVKLEAGTEYYVDFENLGTSGSYYLYNGYAYGLAEYSWGGTVNMAAYSSNDGQTWYSYNYMDLQFALDAQVVETLLADDFRDGNADGWDRAAGAANWEVFGVSTPVSYGNELEYNSAYTQVLRTNQTVSYKLTASQDGTIDSITPYLYDYYRVPITVTVYGDNGGVPDSTPISSTVYVPGSTYYGWLEIDLPDFTCNEGSAYHFVFSVEADTNGYAYLYHASPATDGRSVLTRYNGGGWSVQGGEPSFVLTYGDAAEDIQPYRGCYRYSIYNGYRRGEKFTVEDDMNISSVRVLLGDYGSPNGDIRMRLRRWDDQSVLATASVPASEVPYYTAADWIEFSFGTDAELEAGTTYFIELENEGSSGYYYLHMGYAYGMASYSWGGTENASVYSYDGSTWSVYDYMDLQFTLEGEIVAKSMNASRIGNSDNIMVAGDGGWTDYTVSADIRYNEQGPYFNDAEIYLRYVDRDNFIKVGIRNFYGFWRLKYTVREGTNIVDQGWVHEFSKTERPVVGEWYNLKVKAVGDTYTVFFDGEEVGQFTAGNFSSGKIGVGSMAAQLGIWEPQKGYYFVDDDEYSFWAPEGQGQLNGRPLNLDWGYLDAFYATLILPGSYVMSDIEVQNIDTWINGGLRCLIATDGGVAMKDETGATDMGRIEDLFGVVPAVTSISGLNQATIGGDDHYVTLDYEEGSQITASGSATAWTSVDQGTALATVENGSESVPALIVNTLTDDPVSPKKVFCFNFGADTQDQLAGAFSQIAERALQWAQGEAYKARLELKYPSPLGDVSLDLAILTLDAWILSASGTNTLYVDIPDDGIMTGDNLYWVLYVYAWDAADPWVAHGGFYSSENDSDGGLRVSLPGKGLQILGINGDAFGGREWDTWVAYNTRGETLDLTFGVKEKGTLLYETAFTNAGNYGGWTITPNPNIAWSGTAWDTLRADVVGTGGYSYITRDGLDLADRNITLEYDVFFSAGATNGGVIYRGKVLYVNPAMAGWEDGALQAFDDTGLSIGSWHRVALSIRDGDPYLMSDLYVDGEPVFLSEPIEDTNWTSATAGFLSPYYGGYTEWDNVRFVDEEYSFVTLESLSGEYVPTNANEASFYTWVPDYDPDWWEFAGTEMDGQYEWYVYFRGEDLHSRSNVNIYFSPRLMTEDASFPVDMDAGDTVQVPVEWERLGTNLPAKLTVAIQHVGSGTKYGETEVLVTEESGNALVSVEVSPDAVAGDYMWAAYMYPTNAADPYLERLGFDDTYRSRPDGSPVEPEIEVTVDSTAGEFAIYNDDGLSPNANLFTWPYGAYVDANYTLVPAPEGVESCYALRMTGYIGWGIFSASGTYDLTAFSGGYLKFWLWSFETLKVEIEGPAGVKNYVNVGSTGGYWQEVSIPLSTFSSVDFSQVYGPFMITSYDGAEYLVDDVRYSLTP